MHWLGRRHGAPGAVPPEMNGAFSLTPQFSCRKSRSQTLISLNQLFKVLSTGMNTCPQPWPPLINGLVDDALLKLSPDRN